MKVNIGLSSEGPVLELGEIYCNTVLKTSEGNKLAVCMREDTFEISLVGSNHWFRVDVHSGIIYAMKGSDHDVKVEPAVPLGTLGMLSKDDPKPVGPPGRIWPEGGRSFQDRRTVRGGTSRDRKTEHGNVERGTDL